MDAGKLDRRVTLQRQGAETDDGFQTLPGGWADLADVWARLIPLAGKSENALAGQTQAFGNANWEIRKARDWADLNAKDRLLDRDGRVFNILNVTEQRRGFLFIESVSAADQD